jgi:hypothetical protein
MPNASVGAGSLYRTFSTSVTGYVPTALSYDTLGLYKWVTVTLISMNINNTLDFMTSNYEGSSWNQVPLTRTVSAGGATVASGTTVETTAKNPGTWHGPLPGRYFRLYYTANSASTVTGQVTFSQSGGIQELGSGTGGNGKLVVGTSSKTLLAGQICRSVTIKASRDNTGVLYVGIGAAATVAAGLELHAGEAFTVDIGNTGNVYVIGTNATDYLTYAWVN